MQLTETSAVDLVEGLQAGRWTAVEVARSFLERISGKDPEIGAFLQVHADAALEQAERIDARRATGKSVGKLAGLPLSLKDVLCTRSQPTTCGSRMLENFQPPFDATSVAKLRDADAVFLGKVNMDEFAMGSSCENSAFQATRNPWNLECIPGGSSGGSAACVAAGMAPISIGSDTGGSVRQPAALCGVTGLKPTYGRISRYGLVAFASSLDQIGPVGTSVRDVALLLEVLAGHDPLDSTSIDAPVPPYSQTVEQPLKNLTLGIAKEHFESGLDGDVESAVREALRVYESLGATIKEVSLPHAPHAVGTYYIIACCECSSNLARYDGVHYGHRTDVSQMLAEGGNSNDDLTPLERMYCRSRAEGFGPEVKRRIMLGTYALSAGYYDAYYLQALKVRRLIRQDFDKAFEEVDLLVGPVMPTAAYKLGEKVEDPLSMYLSDLFTVSANLTGQPAISVPCGFTSGGLPIGLHLQAPPMEEERLLRGAWMFQNATDWHQRRPQ